MITFAARVRLHHVNVHCKAFYWAAINSLEQLHIYQRDGLATVRCALLKEMSHIRSLLTSMKKGNEAKLSLSTWVQHLSGVFPRFFVLSGLVWVGLWCFVDVCSDKKQGIKNSRVALELSKSVLWKRKGRETICVWVCWAIGVNASPCCLCDCSCSRESLMGSSGSGRSHRHVHMHPSLESSQTHKHMHTNAHSKHKHQVVQMHTQKYNQAKQTFYSLIMHKRHISCCLTVWALRLCEQGKVFELRGVKHVPNKMHHGFLKKNAHVLEAWWCSG